MRFHLTKPMIDDILSLPGRIERLIYTPVVDLEIRAWTSHEPLPFPRRHNGEMKVFRKGDTWGNLFDCAWFHFIGMVPPSAAGSEVVLLIDLNGEGLVVDGTGLPKQCLTSASSFYDFSLGNPAKTVVPFSLSAAGGDVVDLWVDAGNNDLFGNFQENGTVKEACVAVFNRDVFNLYHDARVMVEFLKELPDNSPRYKRVLFALWNARNILVDYSEPHIRAARMALQPELSKKNGDASLHVSAIGHAHLDLAWLWPIRETKRKGARTFSNVLMLMAQYPDFHFCATQAQLYQWMKEDYPLLFACVKQRITEGRWEALSATWVEPDTNLPWGEALVRQFLYGKTFSRDEFGRDVRVLFLPDSFGYSGVLPQLAQQAGVDYFVTTKMSWDRYNIFPHHSFFWEGIDGSKVLVHMPPEGTYNSSAAPRALRKTENAYLDNASSEHCLTVFGIGDGGGGPGTEHLENLMRERNLEGLPPVNQEPVHDFMRRLESEKASFHTWTGELFLACHQGTYTTQARAKLHNRTMEVALRDLEFTSILARHIAGLRYPHERLAEIWKEVLLYQFHDILPGSSIGRVYEESGARYVAMEKETDEALAATIRALAECVESSGCTRPVMILNTLSWPRKEWVQCDGAWLEASVTAFGISIVDAISPPSFQPASTVGDTVIDNGLLRLEFNTDGCIQSLVDLQNNRQVVPSAAVANALMVYDDPGDAWDFGWDYVLRPLGQFRLESAKSVCDGPRIIVDHVYRFGNSRLAQKVVLTSGSRVVRFETEVDWRETGKMLRALFPIDIRAQEVSCDIQFGFVKRPTHRSTTWDLGKYEIPAQKWIDMSQPNYGVALLKQCKYGHRVEGNLMDIDLLRSPVFPDPAADRGMHQFSYGLYPHAGDILTGGVIRTAYEFNYPLRATTAASHAGPVKTPFTFAEPLTDNVIVESVKQSEDGSHVILRLYEAHGIDCRTEVRFGFLVGAAWSTDILEENPVPAVVHGRDVAIQMRPFEIKTLRIDLEPSPDKVGPSR